LRECWHSQRASDDGGNKFLSAKGFHFYLLLVILLKRSLWNVAGIVVLSHGWWRGANPRRGSQRLPFLILMKPSPWPEVRAFPRGLERNGTHLAERPVMA
jgi:hypothetical protein